MDMSMFENREDSIVGGMSVSNMLKNNTQNVDVEGVLFSRFKNIIVPLGLQLHPIILNDEPDVEIETAGFIDAKKFDQLFYSVGKDLGISTSRTYKNRTMKNPTK